MSIELSDRHAILVRLMRSWRDDPAHEVALAVRNLYHAYRHRHLLIRDDKAGWVACGCRPEPVFPGLYVDGLKVPMGDPKTTPRVGWWSPAM